MFLQETSKKTTTYILVIHKVFIPIYRYMYMHTYTYLQRKQFLQDKCTLKTQPTKCTKTNYSKASDTKDILNNNDNKNEVTFLL